MRRNCSPNHLKSPLIHSYVATSFPRNYPECKHDAVTSTASTVSLVCITGWQPWEANRASGAQRSLQSVLSCLLSVRTSKVGAWGGGAPAGLAAGQVGGGGPVAHSGVRFSFITRGGVAFLSHSRTLAGGGDVAPFSGPPGPCDGECPGTSVPTRDRALDSAEC